MSIFSKTASDSPSAARERTGNGVKGNDGAISIIGPGMRIVGDVNTDGTVRVEGTVEGTLRASKTIVLGKEGAVLGDIVTQDAVIGGRVTGTITAENRLELQATCMVDGDIRARTQHLLVHEGARFSGKIEMLDEASAQYSAKPSDRPDEAVRKKGGERSAGTAAPAAAG